MGTLSTSASDIGNSQDVYKDCAKVQRRKEGTKFTGRAFECSTCGKTYANKYTVVAKAHSSKCPNSDLNSWDPVLKDNVEKGIFIS